MCSDLRPGPDSPPTDELASAEAALGVLQHVLHPISRDEWSNSTPCSKYDVVQLTDHLFTSISLIGGAAGAEFRNGIATIRWSGGLSGWPGPHSTRGIVAGWTAR